MTPEQALAEARVLLQQAVQVEARIKEVESNILALLPTESITRLRISIADMANRMSYLGRPILTSVETRPKQTTSGTIVESL